MVQVTRVSGGGRGPGYGQGGWERGGERGRQGLLEPVMRSSLIQSSQSFTGIKNDKVASKIDRGSTVKQTKLYISWNRLEL